MEELEKISAIRDVKAAIGESAFYFLIASLAIIILGGFLWFLISFIIKVMRDKKKDSGETLEPLSKVQTYIKLYIQRLKGYSKTVLMTENSFLLFSEYGIYYFYLTNEEGLLEGSYHSRWLSKKGSRVPVFNPLVSLQQDFSKFELKNVKCKILLTPNTCYLKTIEYIDEIIIKEKNIIYEMNKLMGYEKMYTKEEIDSMYKNYTVKFCQKEENTLQSN